MPNSKLIRLAPAEPKRFNCPECIENKQRIRLRFLQSVGEQWANVLTRHDYYRCPACHYNFVSTNGGEPELSSS